MTVSSILLSGPFRSDRDMYILYGILCGCQVGRGHHEMVLGKGQVFISFLVGEAVSTFIFLFILPTFSFSYNSQCPSKRLPVKKMSQKISFVNFLLHHEIVNTQILFRV